MVALLHQFLQTKTYIPKAENSKLRPPRERLQRLTLELIFSDEPLFSWKYIPVPNTNMLININSIAKHTGLAPSEIRQASKGNKLIERINTLVSENQQKEIRENYPAYKVAKDIVAVGKALNWHINDTRLAYNFGDDVSLDGTLAEAKKYNDWINQNSSDIQTNPELVLSGLELTALPDFIQHVSVRGLELTGNKFSEFPKFLLDMKGLQSIAFDSEFIKNYIQVTTGNILIDGSGTLYGRDVQFSNNNGRIYVHFVKRLDQ